jgi:hypothetical protein
MLGHRRLRGKVALGAALPLQTRERPLNGCMFAWQGRAVVFVESGLDGPERVFVVAHEVGHYLVEYFAPRRRALRRLGPALLPVFDGRRAPTTAEQLAATLAGVTFGFHVHYMDRPGNGTHRTRQVERSADDMAYELLAPWRDVLAIMKTRGGWPAETQPWCVLLQTRYGIPLARTGPYARRLIGAIQARRSFAETLGL